MAISPKRHWRLALIVSVSGDYDRHIVRKIGYVFSSEQKCVKFLLCFFIWLWRKCVLFLLRCRHIFKHTRYTASTQLLLVTTSVKYIYFYYSTIYTLYNWNEWIFWCVRLARKAFDWCKQRSFQILSMQSANTFLHSEIDTGRRSNNALCNINSEFAVSQRINIRILCGIQVRKNIVRCL